MIEIGRDYPVLDRRWFYGIKFEKDIRTRRTLNIIPILWVKLKYDLILSLNPALIINILFIYLFWFSLRQQTREVAMKRSPLSCFKTFFPQKLMQNFGLYTAVVLRLISLISHLLMSVWFSICYKIGFNYPTLDCNSILFIKSEIHCWRFAPSWNSSITTWLKNCEKRWYQYKKITRKRFIERRNHNFESKTLNKSIFIVYIGVSTPPP